MRVRRSTRRAAILVTLPDQVDYDHRLVNAPGLFSDDGKVHIPTLKRYEEEFIVASLNELRPSEAYLLVESELKDVIEEVVRKFEGAHPWPLELRMKSVWLRPEYGDVFKELFKLCASGEMDIDYGSTCHIPIHLAIQDIGRLFEDVNLYFNHSPEPVLFRIPEIEPELSLKNLLREEGRIHREILASLLKAGRGEKFKLPTKKLRSKILSKYAGQPKAEYIKVGRKITSALDSLRRVGAVREVEEKQEKGWGYTTTHCIQLTRFGKAWAESLEELLEEKGA